jgi:hypothetical protein
MSEQDKSEEQKEAGAAGKPKQKRPYKKPTFRYERVFETNALSCGKVGTTQESCRNNSKLS